jgi:hypothetical protein
MESRGYYSLKLIKTNKNGIPDCIFIKQDDVVFIEVKRPEGKLSKLQEYRIKELNQKGIRAEVWTDFETNFKS